MHPIKVAQLYDSGGVVNDKTGLISGRNMMIDPHHTVCVHCVDTGMVLNLTEQKSQTEFFFLHL